MNALAKWWIHRRTTKDQKDLSGELPGPLTRDRIVHALASHDMTFTEDDDGDLTGIVDANQFWILVHGDADEVLTFVARWSTGLLPSTRRALLRAANDWNRDEILPKVYIRDIDDVLVLFAEYTVVLHTGATDRQIKHIVHTGISSTLQLFDILTSKLPG